MEWSSQRAAGGRLEVTAGTCGAGGAEPLWESPTIEALVIPLAGQWARLSSDL